MRLFAAEGSGAPQLYTLDGKFEYVPLFFFQLLEEDSAAVGRASVSASVVVIAAMVAQIAVLAEELEAGFDQHPDAEVVRSLPGLGTVLGARAEPVWQRQVSQKLCWHLAHPPRVRHQTGRAGPLRPQPAPC